MNSLLDVARAANQTHHYAYIYGQFDASAPYASNLAHDTTNTHNSNTKHSTEVQNKKIKTENCTLFAKFDCITTTDHIFGVSAVHT